MLKILKDCTKRIALTKLTAASVFTAMLTCALPAQANNPAPTLKADAPNRYVVKKGDTLWDISGRYLDSPWRWREIWAANRQVKNPNLIYPDDILLLCVIKGETLVGIDTGEGCLGIEKDIEEKTDTVITPAPTASPMQNVTITPLNNSIPPIPLSTIESWLSKMLIVNPQDFEATPYVIASKKGNLVTTVGDTVYAKGVPLIVGQTYGIYHAGEPYVNPQTTEVIGLEVEQVATGRVFNVASNNISSIHILNSYGSEVREGDRVFIELNNDVAPVFYPKPANVNRGGMIIRTMGSIDTAAKGSIVAINLGVENGAAAGDVLTVNQRGALVRDIRDNDTPVRLPSERAGHIMIFKVFDKISYAYVLDSEVPLKVGDRLLPPSDM